MRPRRRIALLALAVALAGAGAVVLLSRGAGDGGRASSPAGPAGPGRDARAPSPRAAVPDAPSVATPASSPDEPVPEVATLAAAMARRAQGAVRAAAQDLRRRLRTDDAARRAAERALLDRSLPGDVRAAIALVLGTLPGQPSDAALLAALAASPEAGFETCLLFALGARECDDDDEGVFDMGERPWGGAGPAGLGITVKRQIADASVRAAVAARLDRPDPAMRRAAAGALRHSTAQADVRGAFARTLRAEPDDDVATALGESLAAWSRHASDPGERSAVLALVVDRSSEPGFDAYRLRIEDDLRGAPLSTADRERLRSLADPNRPFGFRAFAMTVLAAATSSDGADAPEEARVLLRGVLASDEDAAARDLGARLLGQMPPDDRTVAALSKSSRDDAAWNVRHAAVTALAQFADRDDARAAVEARQTDNDPRVADAAREALARAARR